MDSISKIQSIFNVSIKSQFMKKILILFYKFSLFLCDHPVNEFDITLELNITLITHGLFIHSKFNILDCFYVHYLETYLIKAI